MLTFYALARIILALSTMEKNKQQRMDEFQHKTFVLMFRVLLIFGIPAIAAYFVGDWLDTSYDMRPYGSLAALAVSFIISWALVFRMYFALERERKQIESMEDTTDTSESNE
jgi:hypothetical protein